MTRHLPARTLVALTTTLALFTAGCGAFASAAVASGERIAGETAYWMQEEYHGPSGNPEVDERRLLTLAGERTSSGEVVRTTLTTLGTEHGVSLVIESDQSIDDAVSCVVAAPDGWDAYGDDGQRVELNPPARASSPETFDCRQLLD